MVDGKSLVREYLREVFSEGRLDRMDAYLAGEQFMTGVRELVTRWRSAFSDFNEAVEDVFIDGDRVITVSVLTGTHDGVLESRLGPIPPTGRSVRWSRIAVRRLDGDRFADGFFEEDEVGLLQQLGALELSPSGPTRGRHSPIAAVPDRSK
ncbi:MAG TPA: ester cyclase [Candidatus Eisenbacteria bacterium]|nr:ester cyclase [Candidatus Eisenbacteria bacterium]